MFSEEGCARIMHELVLTSPFVNSFRLPAAAGIEACGLNAQGRRMGAWMCPSGRFFERPVPLGRFPGLANVSGPACGPGAEQLRASQW